MLYTEEICIGSCYYSQWVRYVHGKPLLTDFGELIDQPEDGVVMVSDINDDAVLGITHGGRMFVFMIRNGMVGLERIK